MLCTIGRFDIPIIQMQPPFIVDLLDSNIILFGSSMSGKTSFAKLLINILHKKFDQTCEQIFILDFGGSLSEYRHLPLVSAYFDNSNEEYVKRVFKILDNILKENIKILNGRNYREAADNQPVHTTFIIDNLNAFIDEPRYLAYQEKLAKLCRDGLSKGITVVVTASDTKGLGSYLGNFKQKIAFEMPFDKYSEIFNGKVSLIGNNPGHGFANVTVKPEGVTGTFRMNLPYEVQCFKADPLKEVISGRETDKDSFFLNNLKLKFIFKDETVGYGRQVKKYRTFPKELTVDEYNKLKQTPSVKDISPLSVSVGLDYVDFYPVTVDPSKSHIIAIYGKKEFGKTNLLNLLLNGISDVKKDIRMVFFDDGREQLKSIYKKYKTSLDCVLIDKFETKELCLKDGTVKIKKLSPFQQFYTYLNDNYIDIDKQFMSKIYDVSGQLQKQYANIPDCRGDITPFTVFVIQSKLVYLNTSEGKHFINVTLPQMAAVAEERGFLFIFSDVQKISEGEQNSFFNNIISNAFLLDNIAEFAGERGQKTIFGNMDIKSLKEDYARCELGDGYFYDIEADKLLKLKFIKY